MAFNQDKPVQGSTLSSSELRDNFQHIKNAVGKEHVWDDANPGNMRHRVDQIGLSVTGSTQRDTAYGGVDSTTGSGALSRLYYHIHNGVPAGNYTLQGLLQELVKRSHFHTIENNKYNCNCDCQCGDRD